MFFQCVWYFFRQVSYFYFTSDINNTNNNNNILETPEFIETSTNNKNFLYDKFFEASSVAQINKNTNQTNTNMNDNNNSSPFGIDFSAIQ